jgi:plastocyanin
MALIDIWIQLENHAWDVSPSLPIDRMTSMGTLPVGPLRLVHMHSPMTGANRTQTMQRPMSGEALLLRRYSKTWQAPEDRKINPWDLNEPDPTDAGTMGTIPGATIECNVGDTVRVHFRNMDLRTTPAAPWERGQPLAVLKRTHSLHTHGFTFPAKYDGAYPLSPPDVSQPIDTAERSLWNAVGVKGAFKQGDRVPPGGSFTYSWEASGAANAGIWIYHDHSVADMESTMRGAIGFVVIHNTADKLNEVAITPDRLPGGSWIGSPLVPKEIKIRHRQVGVLDNVLSSLTVESPGRTGDKSKPVLQVGGLYLKLNKDFSLLEGLSLGTYRQPPDQALYLLLFHDMEGAGTCINGRQFLGNTPTIVAGARTRMRFGLGGMGESFHTFHIHGHRWVVPGPSGKTPTAIEQSTQAEPTSQFEDTKVFGPGASFAFTLEEGKGLLRANPPQGEWHLHCHVPSHMMHGMVGSLLVIDGGELALPLPEGQALPVDYEEPAPLPKAYVPVTHEVIIRDGPSHFNPKIIIIFVGDTIRWINQGQQQHSATSDKGIWLSPTIDPGQMHEVKFTRPGDNWYHCDFHSVDEPTFAFGRVWVDPAPNTAPTAPLNPTQAPPTVHQVQINASGFSPKVLTIQAGDIVNWTNMDSSPHQVTDDPHLWFSPILPGGKAFAKTFPNAGTISYHCHIHHEMTATLIIN